MYILQKKTKDRKGGHLSDSITLFLYINFPFIFDLATGIYSFPGMS